MAEELHRKFEEEARKAAAPAKEKNRDDMIEKARQAMSGRSKVRSG